jgi:hypothetical protein
MLKQNFEDLKNKLKAMIFEIDYTKEEKEKIVEAEMNDFLRGADANELYEYFNSELKEISAEEHFSEFRIQSGEGVNLGGILSVIIAALVMSCMKKELLKELTEKLH